jgi:Prokaryotic RING finger family 4
MAIAPASTIAELLLLRSGVLFLEPASAAAPVEVGEAAAAQAVAGFELELANLGYVASARLRARALLAAPVELAKLRDLAIAANQKATGGTRKLEPMFRRFPDGIPTDATALWWDRVIVHYLQRPQQPCLLCRQTGTVHVLNPCQHLVCDRCFDGSNYAGCPICNRAVDRSSPFFRPTPPRPGPPPAATRTFTLLDLGNPTAEQTMETASAALFGSLCLRTQVMSPVDVDALLALISAYPQQVLGWLPAKVPVRENIALIFGTLLRSALAARASRSPRPTLRSKISALVERPRAQAKTSDLPTPTVTEILQVAAGYLTTATDVLRLICALSGTSVALIPEAKVVPVGAKTAKRFVPASPKRAVVIAHHRFKVAKLPRTLRRELLAILDRVAPAQLLEDL